MNSPTADAGDRTARHLTPRDLTPGHLTPRDLAGLRAALDEQLRFLRRRPTGGSPGVAAPARMVLADVEAALRRMDEGRYGVCHRCRLPVDRKRLRVVPQARYCAPCQHLHATRHRPAKAAAPGTASGTSSGATPGPTGHTAGPTDLTGPADLAGPADTAGSAGPADLAGPADTAGSTGPADLAGPADTAGPANPAGSANPTGPADLAGPARAGDR
ncbi:TraR/DksA C4-type zinc finger protein [Streptomyces sp. NPDC002734]|uniref:TraR/DksA C4-type zinc finger protein n=1 Tax=Streptomyces sp. NPDC002734 TaxID=3154426 RepID=UPI00332339EB